MPPGNMVLEVIKLCGGCLPERRPTRRRGELYLHLLVEGSV